MSKKTRNIILGAAIVVVLACVMFLVYRNFSPKAQEGEKNITISIVFDDGTAKDFDVNTDAEYLKEALDTVAKVEGEEGEYGFTIYTIDGVTADYNVDSAYWAIYVNGEYGMYSVSQQPVTDGDAYRIVYEKY